MSWLLFLGLAASDVSAQKLNVCLISAAPGYASDASLASFQRYLEERELAHCVLLKAEGAHNLAGLEKLAGCDVAVLFARRLKLPHEQTAHIRAYLKAGRPLVAIRTASHALEDWPEFARDVLGGDYHGDTSSRFSMRAEPTVESKSHPILANVGRLASVGTLYKTGPLAKEAKLLLWGISPVGREPAAWIHDYRGGRIFYTSLGAPGDFENSSYRRLLTNAIFWAADRKVPVIAPPTLTPVGASNHVLQLKLRNRVESAIGSGRWNVETSTRSVLAAKTAIVICDMWDLHWCQGATQRCEAIAKRMNPVVAAARAAGVTIIHSPSDCMDYYADWPQRRRLQLAAPETPPSLHARPAEPKLPIDDSDGGCDTNDPFYLAWTRQTPHLSVAPEDGVSDKGSEVYSYFRQRGIDTVLVMGVHTNMCVLNRSFAIRQLSKWGLKCILVRDLTDTMYNPALPPRVTHDQGTELVIEHIEKYWAPSITAAELVVGAAH